MAENTEISWAHHTANLWWGCTEVHAGCDHCYAKVWATRYQPTELWGNDGSRMAIKSVWKNLAKWQRDAAAKGIYYRVFVGSMMDIFELSYQAVVDRNGDPLDSLLYEDEHLYMDELRNRLFIEVVPACPNLIFLFLTKRPSNINKLIPSSWLESPPANVMFGTSIVDFKSTATLVPQLLKVNGKRFLSIEPQIAEIPLFSLTGIDWIIQGGESGHHRRPFNLQWARTMRDWCKFQNVPYHFKQVDQVIPIPDDLKIQQFPEYHSWLPVV